MNDESAKTKTKKCKAAGGSGLRIESHELNGPNGGEERGKNVFSSCSKVSEHDVREVTDEERFQIGRHERPLRAVQSID
jgi:hypothetical protein